MLLFSRYVVTTSLYLLFAERTSYCRSQYTVIIASFYKFHYYECLDNSIFLPFAAWTALLTGIYTKYKTNLLVTRFMCIASPLPVRAKDGCCNAPFISYLYLLLFLSCFFLIFLFLLLFFLILFSFDLFSYESDSFNPFPLNTYNLNTFFNYSFSFFSLKWTLLVGVLSLLLVFRTNSAYDRFWEGIFADIAINTAQCDTHFFFYFSPVFLT